MILKKQRAIFILFLVISTAVNAQVKINTTNSLLWEISGKELKQASYIFGTYHLAGKDFIDTLPGISTCYSKTTAVAGEVVLDNMQAAGLKMMPYMLLKGDGLDKVLTPPEYDEVDRYMQKVSTLKLALLNTYKPAAIAALLLDLTAKSTITETNPPIDLYFQDLARKEHKKVTGLETVEFQAELLLGSPLGRQREQLLKMVREEKKNAVDNEKMFADYKAQNLAGLEETLDETQELTPAEADAFLTNRNKNWIRQLPALMQENATFVVVGAGHLVGKTGILNLLREAGYTVSAISSK